jgi:hypothetical protein
MAENHLPIYKPLAFPYQGDDYVIQFRVKNTTTGLYENLTGVVGRCQVKERESRDSPLVLEFNFASDAGDLTAGTIIFVAPHALMTNTTPGTYWYDVQLTKNSERKTYLRGTFKITPEITTEAGYVPAP